MSKIRGTKFFCPSFASVLYHIEHLRFSVFFGFGWIFRNPVEHFLKAIDTITANDVASMAEKLISSPLTMASYGDGNYFI